MHAVYFVFVTNLYFIIRVRPLRVLWADEGRRSIGSFEDQRPRGASLLQGSVDLCAAFIQGSLVAQAQLFRLKADGPAFLANRVYLQITGALVDAVNFGTQRSSRVPGHF